MITKKIETKFILELTKEQLVGIFLLLSGVPASHQQMFEIYQEIDKLIHSKTGKWGNGLSDMVDWSGTKESVCEQIEKCIKDFKL